MAEHKETKAEKAAHEAEDNNKPLHARAPETVDTAKDREVADKLRKEQEDLLKKQEDEQRKAQKDYDKQKEHDKADTKSNK